MGRWLPGVVAGIMVAGAGVLTGTWTGRWDEAGAAPVDAAALDQIPLLLGDWQGQEMELNSREAASYSAVLYRRYVHQRSGQSVAVVLVAGRPGPVSIHSPEYCYPASGYNAAAWVPFQLPFDAAQPPAEFKTAVLTKTQATAQAQVRVLWSWYGWGKWSVPDSPRHAFAGQKVLYKLHVVRETTANETLENDACCDLLRELLGAFQREVAADNR